MSRIYALLVGINDYTGDVARLQGCINDVDNAADYLTSSFADPAVVVLKDADATRSNIIQQFRAHLGRARAGDVAMLHYCGHGARSTAAPEFRAFDLDGRDQAIVCGIEAHVCVSQTVHDLLETGVQVHVPVDAVSSRADTDKQVGLEKMERAGALPSSVETALLELVGAAGSDEFKTIQGLIK